MTRLYRVLDQAIVSRQTPDGQLRKMIRLRFSSADGNTRTTWHDGIKWHCHHAIFSVVCNDVGLCEGSMQSVKWSKRHLPPLAGIRSCVTHLGSGAPRLLNCRHHPSHRTRPKNASHAAQHHDTVYPGTSCSFRPSELQLTTPHFSLLEHHNLQQLKPWYGLIATPHSLRACNGFRVCVCVRLLFATYLVGTLLTLHRHVKYTIPPGIILSLIYRPLSTKLDIYKIAFLITVSMHRREKWPCTNTARLLSYQLYHGTRI